MALHRILRNDGVRILSGRDLSELRLDVCPDHHEAIAKRFYRMKIGGSTIRWEAMEREVIGGGDDTKVRTLGEPEQPQIYILLKLSIPNVWGTVRNVLAVKTHGTACRWPVLLRQQGYRSRSGDASTTCRQCANTSIKRCCYRGCAELCSAFFGLTG